ncbi:reverse transcriptase domain-containing protein [Tanacetum coccineum]
MDDEPVWATEHVVALTPGSAIIIPETANEFAIKGNHLTIVKGNQFDGTTKTDPHKHIHEFLGIYDMFKYRDTKNEVVRLMMFPLSLTGEAKTWLDELNEGTIETNTQPNPRGSKAYQPPQACNEHVNVIFTRSGKSYNPPDNPDDQQNNSENPINFDSDDEDAVRINVPLVDVLAGMPNYGKFLKELISNKHKIEQIYAAFLSDESSAMIQNKVPLLVDPGSFLIPCKFNKTFSCNALAALGASINLMPYSLYAKLSLETLKPTKMSVRLADKSFQYLVGIAENMLVEVVIRVKQKQLNLGVETERMIFNIDSIIKHSYSNDDTYFIIDEILEEYFDALLDEGSKILNSIKGTLLEEEIFSEFDKFMAMVADENSESEFDTEEPPFDKITINADYKIKTSLE